MSTKEDNLHELAQLLNIRENIVLSTEQVSEMFMKPIVDDVMETLGEGEREELDVMMSNYLQKMRSLVDDMTDHAIGLYDKYFDEDEISDMLEFNKTPTGMRLVNVTPALLKDTMEYSVGLARCVASEVFDMGD